MWQNGKLKDIYEEKASEAEYRDWLTQESGREKITFGKNLRPLVCWIYGLVYKRFAKLFNF